MHHGRWGWGRPPTRSATASSASSDVYPTAPRPRRSQSIALEELPDLIAHHRAGESVRSLARSAGVSHETMRQSLAHG